MPDHRCNPLTQRHCVAVPQWWQRQKFTVLGVLYTTVQRPFSTQRNTLRGTSGLLTARVKSPTNPTSTTTLSKRNRQTCVLRTCRSCETPVRFVGKEFPMTMTCRSTSLPTGKYYGGRYVSVRQRLVVYFNIVERRNPFAAGAAVRAEKGQHWSQTFVSAAGHCMALIV